MTFSEYLNLLFQIDELVDIPQKIDLTKYELLDEHIKAPIKRAGKVIFER